MITIHLHGPFRAFHDGPIRLQAETAKEAIEALTAQVKGFRPGVDGMKRLRLVGFDTVESLLMPLKPGQEIHVVPPIFFNEKDGSITQIIVGTVLIVAGTAMGGVFWPTLLISMGASMVIGGVMNLLVPVPKPSKEDEERTRYLGAPPNTVGISVRIPIGYGEDLVQGHILSSDIDAAEIV